GPTGAAVAVVVVGAPGSAAPEHPPVLADDTPGVAVPAGVDPQRRHVVTQPAQPSRVVVLPRPALAAAWRAERAARDAFVAHVDTGMGPRDAVAFAYNAQARGSHAGGSVRWRPSRGVTAGPWAAAFFNSAGRRAATLSGSQINRSVGVHSNTEQMTSRSSSR